MSHNMFMYIYITRTYVADKRESRGRVYRESTLRVFTAAGNDRAPDIAAHSGVHTSPKKKKNDRTAVGAHFTTAQFVHPHLPQ